MDVVIKVGVVLRVLPSYSPFKILRTSLPGIPETDGQHSSWHPFCLRLFGRHPHHQPNRTIAQTTPPSRLPTHLRQLDGHNWKKSMFGINELTYLGHQVTPSGIMPLRSSVQAVNDFPMPTSKASLQGQPPALPEHDQLLPPLHAKVDHQTPPPPQSHPG